MYLPPLRSLDELTSDPTLRAVRPWWIVILGTGVLYFVPAQDVMDMPLTGRTINWLASFIPSIARWAELSPFPAHTKLFWILVWAMVPLHVYWLMSSADARKRLQSRDREKVAAKSIWARLLGIILFAALLSALVLLPFNFAIVDTPPCRVCVNTVRWAQLFIGCTYSLSVSGLIALFVSVFPLIFIKPSQSRGETNV